MPSSAKIRAAYVAASSDEAYRVNWWEMSVADTTSNRKKSHPSNKNFYIISIAMKVVRASSKILNLPFKRWLARRKMGEGDHCVDGAAS